MATQRKPPTPKQVKRAPAKTREARENQLVDSAFALAEKQIQEGTASSQVITHFLKLGSTRERLEQQKITNENLLAKAKVDQIESQARMEDLYSKAIKSMRSYQGVEMPEDEE